MDCGVFECLLIKRWQSFKLGVHGSLHGVYYRLNNFFFGSVTRRYAVSFVTKVPLQNAYLTRPIRFCLKLGMNIRGLRGGGEFTVMLYRSTKTVLVYTKFLLV